MSGIKNHSSGVKTIIVYFSCPAPRTLSRLPLVKCLTSYWCLLFTESEEGVDDDGNVIEEDGADQNGKRKRFRQEVVKKVCLVFSCYNVYLENTIISIVASLFWSVFLDTMPLWENHKIASETLRVINFKNESLTLSKLLLDRNKWSCKGVKFGKDYYCTCMY